MVPKGKARVAAPVVSKCRHGDISQEYKKKYAMHECKQGTHHTIILFYCSLVIAICMMPQDKF